MTASDATGPSGADTRSVADRALDVLVFAPAGVLLTAAEDLPGMAEKGRTRLEQTIRNAQVVGRFAVDIGWRQVHEQLDWLVGDRHRSAPAPDDPSAATDSAATDSAATDSAATDSAATDSAASAASGATLRPRPRAAASGSGPAIAVPTGPRGPRAHAPSAARPPAPTGARDPAVDAAIPEYDTLSASQVVRRLDGLGPDELRAVAAHERATRSRRTILHRTEQLLGTGETPDASPPAASEPSTA